MFLNASGSGNHEPLIVISKYVECGSAVYPTPWNDYNIKQFEEFGFECYKRNNNFNLWFPEVGVYIQHVECMRDLPNCRTKFVAVQDII